MSLNRNEQGLYDYITRHPEERQYVHGKVQKICALERASDAAASRLDSELWRYYEERSANVPALREASAGRRISMRNLAEYLIRIWTEPKARKPAEAPTPLETDFQA
jgi:hypothetical protein